MKRFASAASRILVMLAVTAPLSTFSQDAPPAAPVRPVTDTYFGQSVTDPYRWMEDTKSSEMQAWMRGQAEYSGAKLRAMPLREDFLRELNNLDKAGAIVRSVMRRGDRYFYLKTLPGEPNAKLYTRVGAAGAETQLVDPAMYAETGKQAAISAFSPSPDGRRVSFLIAGSGGEYGTIRVLDVASRLLTPDEIPDTRWSAGEWTPDSRGFAYAYFPNLKKAGVSEAKKAGELRTHFHTLGSKYADDRAIAGWGVASGIDVDTVAIAMPFFTPGATQAIMAVNSGVTPASAVWVAPMAAVNGGSVAPSWRRIATLEDEVAVVQEAGGYLYLMTYKGAPRYRVLRMPVSNPDLSKAEAFFPESKAVVVGIAAAKDALYVSTLDAGTRRVQRVDYKTGKATLLTPPTPGSVFISDYSLEREGALVSVDGWTAERAQYEYTPGTGFKKIQLAPPLGIRGDDIEVVETFAKSHDGTMVPMVILHKKGLKKDGTAPTLMNGYGAYGVENVSPFFYTQILPWLRRSGVFVWTGIRGGGEYGEAWHKAGFQQTKANTWKDFIACGEHLIAQGYTSPKHLGIEGGSAGGILISNAIAERPDLFGAAIIRVGLNNALRFETTSNGPSNIPEFGTASTEAGFQSLMGMDGYHKVKDGVKYPAVLLTHGVYDPRVEPWMSAKMAARLQAASSSGKPVLLRLDYDSGHGMGSSRKQQNEEMADVGAFLWTMLR